MPNLRVSNHTLARRTELVLRCVFESKHLPIGLLMARRCKSNIEHRAWKGNESRLEPNGTNSVLQMFLNLQANSSCLSTFVVGFSFWIFNEKENIH